MPWKPLSTVAREKAFKKEGGYGYEAELAARLEVMAELAAGQREAAGLSPANVPEPVPRSLWVFAQLGEAIDPYPLWQSRGNVVVDFRCDAVAAWDPVNERYRVLYSEVMVSDLAGATIEPAYPPGETKAPPGRKPGQAPTARAMWAIAKGILDDPKQRPELKRGWRIALARKVKGTFPSYDDETIAKALRRDLDAWEEQQKKQQPG